MIVVIDGNDGTGKSTLAEKLRAKGYHVKDRGIPTKLTSNPELKVNSEEIYIILDVPVEVSRERLKKAGRDLNEEYHTVEDLTKYRNRFLRIANEIDCVLIDASGSPEEVFEEAIKILKCVSYLDFRAFSPPTIDTFGACTRKVLYHSLCESIRSIRRLREELETRPFSMSIALNELSDAFEHLGRANKGVSVMYDINHPLSYSALKAHKRVKNILLEELHNFSKRKIR